MGKETTTAGGFRVLVAEDNPVNQKILRLILGRAGHFVHLVENGEDALDALQNEALDMALLDLGMPGMGGVETARLYRGASRGGTRIPLIALSAGPHSETRRRCEEAGFAAYVTKPVGSKGLLEAVAGMGGTTRLGQNSLKVFEGTPIRQLHY